MPCLCILKSGHLSYCYPDGVWIREVPPLCKQMIVLCTTSPPTSSHLHALTDYSSHDDSGWTHPLSYMTMSSSRNPCANDTLDKFTGDSLLHFSFNPGGNFTSPNEPQLGGSFVRAFTNQGLHTSLNVPSVHQMQSSTGDASQLFPSAAQNPNKAIVTIDAQSSVILMTNEITCELFGYQCNELVGMKVQNLFTEPYRAKQHALVERNIDASGKEVLVSGKVVSFFSLDSEFGQSQAA